METLNSSHVLTVFLWLFATMIIMMIICGTQFVTRQLVSDHCAKPPRNPYFRRPSFWHGKIHNEKHFLWENIRVLKGKGLKIVAMTKEVCTDYYYIFYGNPAHHTILSSVCNCLILYNTICKFGRRSKKGPREENLRWICNS